MNNPLASKHQRDCLDTGVELQTCNHTKVANRAVILTDLFIYGSTCTWYFFSFLPNQIWKFC